MLEGLLGLGNFLKCYCSSSLLVYQEGIVMFEDHTQFSSSSDQFSSSSDLSLMYIFIMFEDHTHISIINNLHHIYLHQKKEEDGHVRLV